MKIKIFAKIGDAYVVELPNTVANAGYIDDAINDWVDDNLKNVQFWSYCN